MKLLPYESYTLSSRLSPAEIQLRLRAIIEQNWRNPARYNGQIYKAKGSTEGFRVSRIVKSRNTIRAVIIGRYSFHGSGTDIHIRIRPVIVGIIFMSFWFGVVGSICITLLIAAAQAGTLKGATPAAIIPFGVFALAYALIMDSFKREKEGAKAFLAELLRPREEAIAHP